MRYGIFSDIHGNLQALDAVLNSFKKEKIDIYICPGDVVGYGANPNECIEAVKKLKTKCIAGNHDWAVLGKLDTAFFNSVAKAAVTWSQKRLSSESISFLGNLRLLGKDKNCDFVHGTMQNPEHFDYLTTLPQVIEMFPLMKRNICFVGHSHMPGIFEKKQKKVSFLSGMDADILAGCQYIVNVGSVGQPRDGNPKAAYCIYDTDKKTIKIKRVGYDFKEAQKRIVEAGLPPFLATRLEVGR